MDKTVNVCLVCMDKISIKDNQFILQNVQYESTGPVHCCWHLNLCSVCILIWYYFHCGSRFRLCTRSSISMYCFCVQAKRTCIRIQRLARASHSSLSQCFWAVSNVLKIIHRTRGWLLCYTPFSETHKQFQRSGQTSEVPSWQQQLQTFAVNLLEWRSAVLGTFRCFLSLA